VADPWASPVERGHELGEDASSNSEHAETDRSAEGKNGDPDEALDCGEFIRLRSLANREQRPPRSGGLDDLLRFWGRCWRRCERFVARRKATPRFRVGAFPLGKHVGCGPPPACVEQGCGLRQVAAGGVVTDPNAVCDFLGAVALMVEAQALALSRSQTLETTLIHSEGLTAFRCAPKRSPDAQGWWRAAADAQPIAIRRLVLAAADIRPAHARQIAPFRMKSCGPVRNLCRSSNIPRTE
jgi:hypothetical protein